MVVLQRRILILYGGMAWYLRSVWARVKMGVAW